MFQSVPVPLTQGGGDDHFCKQLPNNTGAGPSKHHLCGRVELPDDALFIHHDDGVHGRSQQVGPFRLAGAEFAVLPARFQQNHDLPAQDAECLLLFARQLARTVIKHTKRPQRRPFRTDQRRSRIEAEARVLNHERISRKAGVFGGIRHNEQAGIVHRMHTK